jgi:hypothetical protein
MSEAGFQRLSLVVACAAALAAGIALGLQGPAKEETGTVMSAKARTSVPADAGAGTRDWDARSPRNEARLERRVIGKCDDESLWAWLLVPTDELQTLDIVIDELIDRKGWDTMQYLMALEKSTERDGALRRVYGRLAEKDPWKAYELWKEHGDSLRSCSDLAFHWMILAGGSVSAEKMIEVLEEAFKEQKAYSVAPRYPHDFDFKKLLDYLITEKSLPTFHSSIHLEEWAKRSPADAAAWYREKGPLLMNSSDQVDIYRSVAETNLEDGEMAAALQAIDERTHAVDVWSELASSGGGKLDPRLLRSARIVGEEHKYLKLALAKTRFKETLDPSWKEIPKAERMRAKAAVEEAWRKEIVGPTHDRARARWAEMVNRAWDD